MTTSQISRLLDRLLSGTIFEELSKRQQLNYLIACEHLDEVTRAEKLEQITDLPTADPSARARAALAMCQIPTSDKKRSWSRFLDLAFSQDKAVQEAALAEASAQWTRDDSWLRQAVPSLATEIDDKRLWQLIGRLKRDSGRSPDRLDNVPLAKRVKLAAIMGALSISGIRKLATASLTAAAALAMAMVLSVPFNLGVVDPSDLLAAPFLVYFTALLTTWGALALFAPAHASPDRLAALPGQTAVALLFGLLVGVFCFLVTQALMEDGAQHIFRKGFWQGLGLLTLGLGIVRPATLVAYGLSAHRAVRVLLQIVIGIAPSVFIFLAVVILHRDDGRVLEIATLALGLPVSLSLAIAFSIIDNVDPDAAAVDSSFARWPIACFLVALGLAGVASVRPAVTDRDELFDTSFSEDFLFDPRHSEWLHLLPVSETRRINIGVQQSVNIQPVGVGGGHTLAILSVDRPDQSVAPRVQGSATPGGFGIFDLTPGQYDICVRPSGRNEACTTNSTETETVPARVFAEGLTSHIADKAPAWPRELITQQLLHVESIATPTGYLRVRIEDPGDNDDRQSTVEAFDALAASLSPEGSSDFLLATADTVLPVVIGSEGEPLSVRRGSLVFWPQNGNSLAIVSGLVGTGRPDQVVYRLQPNAEPPASLVGFPAEEVTREQVSKLRVYMELTQRVRDRLESHDLMIAALDKPEAFADIKAVFTGRNPWPEKVFFESGTNGSFGIFEVMEVDDQSGVARARLVNGWTAQPSLNFCYRIPDIQRGAIPIKDEEFWNTRVDDLSSATGVPTIQPNYEKGKSAEDCAEIDAEAFSPVIRGIPLAQPLLFRKPVEGDLRLAARIPDNDAVLHIAAGSDPGRSVDDAGSSDETALLDGPLGTLYRICLRAFADDSQAESCETAPALDMENLGIPGTADAAGEIEITWSDETKVTGPDEAATILDFEDFLTSLDEPAAEGTLRLLQHRRQDGNNSWHKGSLFLDDPDGRLRPLAGLVSSTPESEITAGNKFQRPQESASEGCALTVESGKFADKSLLTLSSDGLAEVIDLIRKYHVVAAKRHDVPHWTVRSEAALAALLAGFDSALAGALQAEGCQQQSGNPTHYLRIGRDGDYLALHEVGTHIKPDETHTDTILLSYGVRESLPDADCGPADSFVEPLQLNVDEVEGWSRTVATAAAGRGLVLNAEAVARSVQCEEPWDRLVEKAGDYIEELFAGDLKNPPPETEKYLDDFYVVSTQLAGGAHVEFLPNGTVLKAMGAGADNEDDMEFEIVLGYTNCEETCWVGSQSVTYLGSGWVPSYAFLPQRASMVWDVASRDTARQGTFMDRRSEFGITDTTEAEFPIRDLP